MSAMGIQEVRGEPHTETLTRRLADRGVLIRAGQLRACADRRLGSG